MFLISELKRVLFDCFFLSSVTEEQRHNLLQKKRRKNVQEKEGEERRKNMTVEQENGEAKDQFPVGMRVLAVDDDPTCLLLLGTLLRRCQYHVTTTSQAISALKMLRENKNKFDLVISDVHMPDMDGFKLLELVGLEMDLPVIMLSANSDPKLVMKGIAHGACDYLLKPVRMEELKNIWQHVIRRRKFDKDCNNFDNQDKLSHGSGEASADHKLNKKRKDQNEDEDEDQDENGHESEDSTTQKKPRVVWSVELHRKFVAAVNQLGIDKAVPKKILDLMNVEKLTRENVASHLQKYRLYLKRISTVANQQANMVAALGRTDASYLQMGSGLGFHNISGTGQFHNAAYRSLSPSGLLGRLNSPAGLSMHSLSSPRMIRLGQLQNTGHVTNNQSQYLQTALPGNSGNVLQGMLTSLELDQIQSSNKDLNCIKDLSTNNGNAISFSTTIGFSDAKTVVGQSKSSSLGVSNKPLVLERNTQRPPDGQKFSKRSPLAVASSDSGFSSHFPDPGRCNGNWSSAVQSNMERSTSFTSNDCSRQVTLHPSNIGDSLSTMCLQNGNNFPNALPTDLQESKAVLQSQITRSRSNAGQMINNTLRRWEDQRQDNTYLLNTSALPIHGAGNLTVHDLDPNDTIFHRTTSFNSTRQTYFMDTPLMKQNDIENLSMEAVMQSNEGYITAQLEPESSYASNNFGSLEDLASVIVKQAQDHKATVTEAEYGFDAYSLRTCM